MGWEQGRQYKRNPNEVDVVERLDEDYVAV
jgi:hypothetical protein